MTATSEPTTCTTCGHVGEVDIPSSTAARVGDLLRRSPRLQLKVTRSRAAHTLSNSFATVSRLRYRYFTHLD